MLKKLWYSPLLTTLADVRAALTSFAPIRLAILVEAAIDTGNGIMNIVPATVTRILCAARYSVPNWLDVRVRISKASHSATTIIMPGMASWIIGPVTQMSVYMDHKEYLTNNKKFKEFSAWTGWQVTYPSSLELVC